MKLVLGMDWTFLIDGYINQISRKYQLILSPMVRRIFSISNKGDFEV